MSGGPHTVIGMDQLALFDAPPWSRVIGVFDLETTGVDVAADRIVTAHVGLLDGAGTVLRARDWLADPGIAIPEGATAVHGVTTEHARTHGQPARTVTAEVIAALTELFDAGIPVVAYNAPFDFSMLKNEALRHGMTPIASPAPVIDPLVMDKAYDRWRRGKRTLSVVAMPTPKQMAAYTKTVYECCPLPSEEPATAAGPTAPQHERRDITRRGVPVVTRPHRFHIQAAVAPRGARRNMEKSHAPATTPQLPAPRERLL
ncbi:MAG: hypothetical protein J0I66_00740 [Microbacterium sp.]|nr:hypothetical protein [Microbacterium sp.]